MIGRDARYCLLLPQVEVGDNKEEQLATDIDQGWAWVIAVSAMCAYATSSGLSSLHNTNLPLLVNVLFVYYLTPPLSKLIMANLLDVEMPRR